VVIAACCFDWRLQVARQREIPSGSERVERPGASGHQDRAQAQAGLSS